MGGGARERYFVGLESAFSGQSIGGCMPGNNRKASSIEYGSGKTGRNNICDYNTFIRVDGFNSNHAIRANH